jgi:hypothetical protein
VANRRRSFESRLLVWALGLGALLLAIGAVLTAPVVSVAGILVLAAVVLRWDARSRARRRARRRS